MNEYTRLFLHFLHALGETRRRVDVPVRHPSHQRHPRACARRDPDDALARCSGLTVDWSGGTRIGEALARFNRDWSRRVLGQGAIMLLFTDGLERDNLDKLEAEMERLHEIEPAHHLGQPAAALWRLRRQGRGIRAMLPHVDSFRPIHNLASMAELCRALSGSKELRGQFKARLLAAG